MISLFIPVIDYSKSCQFIFLSDLDHDFRVQLFVFGVHFSVLFLSLADRKDYAAIISLGLPTSFIMQIVKALVFVSNAFITAHSVLLSFNCISGLYTATNV